VMYEEPFFRLDRRDVMPADFVKLLMEEEKEEERELLGVEGSFSEDNVAEERESSEEKGEPNQEIMIVVINH